MTRKTTTQFANVIIDAITYQEMIAKVDKWLEDKNSRSHHIATINAYCISLALKNSRLSRIYSTADIAGPDGEPFVKWMRFIGRQKADKICARDTMLQLIERSKETNYTFYLYGGHPDVLENMVKNLQRDFPHINIIGYHSPPFRELSKKEDEKFVNEVNRLKPDIIFVGLGTPKQDYWIDNHLSKIKGSIMITCGATFDFFGGRIKMAPSWIQKSGFEWLYRMLGKDFKRLWRRYTINNINFLWAFFIQKVGIKSFYSKREVRPNY
jgi:N-acetylglucosaminyldiphosphoundecaprenol N-acetyl-beta-D-mannosaminyltransferase